MLSLLGNFCLVLICACVTWIDYCLHLISSYYNAGLHEILTVKEDAWALRRQNKALKHPKIIM